MKTHQQIDKRSLALARAIVAKIDADPHCIGLQKARSVCERWYKMNHQTAAKEWLDILQKPWNEIKTILLDESEKGRRLRQNSPFCGILRNKERWDIYRKYRKYET